MKPRGAWIGRTLLLVVGDVACAWGVFGCAVWLRHSWAKGEDLAAVWQALGPLGGYGWLAAVAVAAVLGLYLTGTYEEPLQGLQGRGAFALASAIAGTVLIFFHFLLGPKVSRIALLLFPLAFVVVVRAWRGLADSLNPIGQRAVLVLGEGPDAENAAGALERHEIPGHFLLAWQTSLETLRGAQPDAFPVPDEARDVVFASSGPEDRAALVPLLERCLRRDFELWVLPGLGDIVASRVTTRSLGDLPLVPVSTRATCRLAAVHRRAFDLVTASLLAVLAIPLLAMVTAAVAIDSPGPPWVRQRRVGRNGRWFSLWKVRTMRLGAEDDTGPILALRDDTRTTRVGRILRRTRLDELPQLLQVLAGSMSLIGPRPERPEFVARYEREIPGYRLRHWLKPGLTGLAQIMGAYATRPEVKLRYDLGYLFHWSPALDLLILLRTAATILRGNGT